MNAVNPSLVYTPFTAGMKEQLDLVAAFEVRIPMGRGAEPGDIVGAVAFLTGEDAHFVTGVNLPVDGGTSASNGQPRSASVAKPRLPDSWVPEMAVFDDKANFVACGQGRWDTRDDSLDLARAERRAP